MTQTKAVAHWRKKRRAMQRNADAQREVTERVILAVNGGVVDAEFEEGKTSIPLSRLADEARDILVESRAMYAGRLPRRYSPNQVALARLIVGALRGQNGVDEVIEATRAKPRRRAEKPREVWAGTIVTPKAPPVGFELDDLLYFCRGCRRGKAERKMLGVSRLVDYFVVDGGTAGHDSDVTVPSRRSIAPDEGTAVLQREWRFADADELREFDVRLRAAWDCALDIIAGNVYRVARSFVVNQSVVRVGTRLVAVPLNAQRGNRIGDDAEKAALQFIDVPNKKPRAPYGRMLPAVRMLDLYSGVAQFACDPRDIEPVPYDKLIWERLVLPAVQKDELLEAIYREDAGREQVYRKWGLATKHKGNGLVILCQGPPGVGKTMTAEAVSAMLERPLLTIQAWAVQNEAHIEHILEMAAKWQMVVLIDEAEAFLTSRIEGAAQQNALIAVMLRQMEKFNGIMILTTNRDFELDAAARSRVHLTLRYDLPDRALRARIWRNAIPRQLAVSGDLNGFADLAEFSLNGRQIDHIVLAAASRAAREELPAVPIGYLSAIASRVASSNGGSKVGFGR